MIFPGNGGSLSEFELPVLYSPDSLKTVPEVTLTVSPSLTRMWELSEMNLGVGKLLVSLSASFSTALAPSCPS